MTQIPDSLSSIGMGWHALAMELHEWLLREDPNYTLDGLEEKFGQMRIYAGGKPGIHEIIDNYEERSGHMCSRCGAPGKRHQHDTRITTLCNDCSGGKKAPGLAMPAADSSRRKN